MRKIINTIFSSCLVLIATVSLHAQNTELTIPQRFQEMVESSESYKQYRLITRGDLNKFLNVLSDSINSFQAREELLNTELSALKTEVESLKAEIEVLNTSLTESKSRNDSIYFLGADFRKATYHLMVWAIVLALAVLFGAAYYMYNRSNKITQDARKEAQRVNNEFEVFRMNAKQKQVKIKRELQTALNKLDEKGIRV